MALLVSKKFISMLPAFISHLMKLLLVSARQLLVSEK